MQFKLKSDFKPSGDQPAAIQKLTAGLKKKYHNQTLLGVTGSGKTFTIAGVIAKVQRPTLVIAHNKTLAAQLTSEFRAFFPKNAVEYFVSYYDYYQPEAYLPNTDTYIEKETQINDEIDRLRHAATQAILTRDDVIIVASVSCIYGLGSPTEYQASVANLHVGSAINRQDLLLKLVELQYQRNDTELQRGTFRVRGNLIEIMPIDREVIYRLTLTGDRIAKIEILDFINRHLLESPSEIWLYPAKHYVVSSQRKDQALKSIETEMEKVAKGFGQSGKLLEQERIVRRTNYDLELIREIGYCNGIENYSRYFDGRRPGEPPYTLLDYFSKKGWLLIVDESHVTVPQIGGMYEGDRSRKQTLVKYGFRLPSALDNRPLKFPEFTSRMPQTIFISATPGPYELKKSQAIVEQIVRPTGLVDPAVEILPTRGQIDNLTDEIKTQIKNGERTLVTTLTKRMAEDLSAYLKEQGIKVRYLHSDIETLQRIEILRDLRAGKFDVLVGVNLLREGLDLPEVSLVAILDADKEGFLRSQTSLIQTIGRAARNVNGRVILYADEITGSMRRALDETARRRRIQIEYNRRHQITPRTITKAIKSILADIGPVRLDPIERDVASSDLPELIRQKQLAMKQAAQELDFEEAAVLRDEIIQLKKLGALKIPE